MNCSLRMLKGASRYDKDEMETPESKLIRLVVFWFSLERSKMLFCFGGNTYYRNVKRQQQLRTLLGDIIGF